MIQKFINFITGVEHNVESILSSFTKTVKALEVHAEKKLDEVLFHGEVISKAEALSDAAYDEAMKAQKAASAIKSAVGL